MILVFTRNVMTATAVRSLSVKADHRRVYVFDNRMAFLVCATVFCQAVKIIDVLDRETFRDVKWLAKKMEVRGLNNIRYLVRRGVYSTHINAKDFIFSLAQLKYIVRKKRISGTGLNNLLSAGGLSLTGCIKEQLRNMLHPDVYVFMLKDRLGLESTRELCAVLRLCEFAEFHEQSVYRRADRAVQSARAGEYASLTGRAG